MTHSTERIRWPERFGTEHSPVRVVNEREVAVAPPVVWAWLVRAPGWPRWYPNAHRVRLLDGADELFLGARFRWRTFSIRLRSEVAQFEPFECMAWTGDAIGVSVFHAWLITPTPRGSLVRTEERQRGSLARLCNALLPRRMSNGHELWLRSLADVAQVGRPGPGG